MQLTDSTGTIVPAGYTLSTVPGDVQEWDLSRDGASVGTIVRHQHTRGHVYEVFAGYRSTDPQTIGDAIATAIEMRNRWDGIGE